MSADPSARAQEGRRFDVAVIGGGAVGLGTAMALAVVHRASVVVVEAENVLARHQTGNNSGVIHSGLYYKPGSLKAVNCTTGRELMYRFCAENGIAHERCGKLVVATEAREIPALDELERRGRANGLHGIRRLRAEELKEYEPHVVGIAGLHVPDTGIVDYPHVTRTFAQLARQHDAEVRTGSRVHAVRRMPDALVVETSRGAIECRSLVNCAGLQSDRMARLCGVDPKLRIIPFRGEYYELAPSSHSLVRNLIYPVPDPTFPFLGVHFTRMIHGGVEAGPNAVLAWKREGYSHADISPGDMAELLRFPGFWRMAGRFWKTGMSEMHRSFSKRAFVGALRKLIPSLRLDDVTRSGAGVRAQAVEADGLLVDDFRIVEAERMVHVLNAPSPGATASISIGHTIADIAAKNFGLAAS